VKLMASKAFGTRASRWAGRRRFEVLSLVAQTGTENGTRSEGRVNLTLDPACVCVSGWIEGPPRQMIF
jgi:hypothetical protein